MRKCVQIIVPKEVVMMREFIKEYGKIFLIPIVIIIILLGMIVHQRITMAKEDKIRAEEEKEFIQAFENERVAEKEKENKPYIEVKPAKTVPDPTPEPTPTSEQTPEPKTGKQESSLQAYTYDKYFAEKDKSKQKSEPTPTPTPKSTSTPTPEQTPKPKPVETRKAITSLTDEDIQRLQQYPTIRVGILTDFNEMYENERDNCEALMTMFSPVHLYPKAKVTWITDPRLVYYSDICQFCVRGVLELTYYRDNDLNLEPNQRYNVDVEYRLRNSADKNGKITLKMEGPPVYLSPFYKVVE